MLFIETSKTESIKNKDFDFKNTVSIEKILDFI